MEIKTHLSTNFFCHSFSIIPFRIPSSRNVDSRTGLAFVLVSSFIFLFLLHITCARIKPAAFEFMLNFLYHMVYGIV